MKKRTCEKLLRIKIEAKLSLNVHIDEICEKAGFK